MQRSALLLLALFGLCASACGGSPSLVVGPFGGPTHHFYVDRLSMPRHGQLGADYGDGVARDQLATLDSLLALQQLQSTTVTEELASGALRLRVQLTTEDDRLQNDDSVGVRITGGTTKGDVLGATLRNGRLLTNAIRDLGEPSFSTLPLPLFADSDPVEWPLEAVQLALVPDGKGGYDGELHGAADFTNSRDDILAAAYQSVVQMVNARPESRTWAIHELDVDRDGMISRAELAGNPWVESAVAPDLQLHDAAGKFAPQRTAVAPDALSVAIGLHLAPCPDAACHLPPAPPRCDDRVKNGDETDVDCGGSCGRCAAGLACASDGECLSGTCTGGLCATPTCSDGRRDGFEIDVDCGPGCTLCGAGKRCFDAGDCLSGSCVHGTCGAAIVP